MATIYGNNIMATMAIMATLGNGNFWHQILALTSTICQFTLEGSSFASHYASQVMHQSRIASFKEVYAPSLSFMEVYPDLTSSNYGYLVGRLDLVV